MYPDDEGTTKKQKPQSSSDKKAKEAQANEFDVADLNTDFTKIDTGQANQSLLDIKQQALSQLSPLVDNLEQSPEQHFRTLMMIIQETDNSEMIDKAYATALQLKDPKERAQALLAVANEINYFTSK